MPGIQPKYTDGKAVVIPTTASNLCNGYTYTVEDYSPSVGAEQKAVTDALMNHIGSDTRGTAQTGNMTVVYTALSWGDITDDHSVKPGHVFLHRSNYIIAGQITAAYKTGDTVKASFPWIQAVNPVITSALSWAYGQGKAVTKASGSAWNYTNTVANTRAGATGVWSLTGAPSGCTINPSTGAITYTTPVVGSYTLEITYTETLATDASTPVLAGYSTIYLTVT